MSENREYQDSEKRLTGEEEYRIDMKIRISTIVMAVCILAYLIFCAMKKIEIGPVYYVIVIAFIALYWGVSDLLGLKLKHGFAGRSERQKSAYRKMAALDLIGDIGLGVFLIGLDSNYSLLGAVVYMVGIMSGRKYRAEYEKEDSEEEQEKEEQKTAPLPDASGRSESRSASERLAELNRAAQEAGNATLDGTGAAAGDEAAHDGAGGDDPSAAGLSSGEK